MKTSLLTFLLIYTTLISCMSQNTVDIRKFGAVGDARTLNTESIQAAIDQVAASGGGSVIIPKGNFVTGSIMLKDDVELKLEEGAVLLGSTDFNHYKQGSHWYALVLSLDAKNVRISGEGVIDGQALDLVDDVMTKLTRGEIEASQYRRNRPNEAVRPQLIEFTNVSNVTIQDVTLRNASGWTQTYINCDSLLLKGVKVRCTKYWNNDGLDLVDCTNVVVEDCDIISEDDGICLKSHDSSRICENIVIRNCKVSSGSSAFKLGTASHGGFKNIRVDNLYIYDTFRSAIALMVVDGGYMKDVEISNVTVKNSSGSFFIDIGHRNQKADIGTIENIRLNNIDMEVNLDGKNINYHRPNFHFPPRGERPAPHNPYPSTISGLPGHPIKNISFTDVTVKYFGGGKKQVAHISTDSLFQVPYNEKKYPEFHMFGELPASAFFVRNVEGIQFKNLNITYLEPDYRPAFIFDKVRDLTINELAVTNIENLPLVVLNEVQGEKIKNIKASLKGDIIKKQN
ncbi:glycosyl hydrolase family 28 protein [Fulvivirgaceae bacterium BMA12]|uniref:Glycosyl hydrolase family 28 protein n=1 Tax=Agaribacillus aureus TaxID=3051825 RepID=A0ABT8L4R2_9BACT|nr:glycosyl hydrolase family 28 protein [Fulvivirgaceae bacterium BMA12]